MLHCWIGWFFFFSCEEVTLWWGLEGGVSMYEILFVEDMYLIMDMLFELLPWEGEYL